MLATIIETGKLAQVFLYSLLSGVGVAIIFSLAVSSAAGLLDAVRDHRNAAAAMWGTLVTVFVLAMLAVIVLGIVVMSTK